MKTNGTRIFLMRSILFIILLIYFSFVVFAQSNHRFFTVKGLPVQNFVGNAQTAPVQSFRGMAIKEGTRLEWLMAEDATITSVTLERKNKEGNFTSIAEFWLNMEGNSSEIRKDFSFVDKFAKRGSYSYRLTIHKASGELESSEILVIKKK